MTLKIDIISKEMLVTEPLKARINEKVGKVIEKLGNPNLVNSAHVTLRLHKNNPNEIHSSSTKKDSQITEVTFRMKGGRVLHASERTDDMYASIDLASHKIAKKLKTYKEKVKEKHAKDVDKDTNAFFDESELIVSLDDKYKELAKVSDIFSIAPDKIQMKQFEMPSLSLKEATEQLLMTEFEFFMFKNVDKASELNVIYKRKSGGIGCISPQQ
jgi:putative sigma-54 modulation protein